jgi:GNAT superfamily N-acetyltransferase
MRIRTAEERDAVALAHVLVTTFRVAHRDQLPPDYPYLGLEQSAHNWARTLRALHGERGGRERVFAAEDEGGKIVGVAMAGPLRPADDAASVADLTVLYVLTGQQRRGIGRRLLAAVAHWAEERGYRALQVRVLAVNAPARCFYEACGARYVGEEMRHEETVALTQAVYAWSDLAALAAGGEKGSSAAR